MNVLVACEESQVVCIAFREKGHNAFSCDLQHCSGNHPEWHIVSDALFVLYAPCSFTTQDGNSHFIDKWDMLIAHPPCTFLSNVGTPLLRRDPTRIEKGNQAALFFMKFYDAPIDKIVVENPKVMKRFGLPGYSQTVQPYHFNDMNDSCYSKLTCLWIKGLPPLIETTPGWFPDGSWVKLHSSSKIRSKTFPGIARAMANQWG